MNDMAKRKQLPEGSMFTQSDYEALRMHRKNLVDWVQKCDKAQSCGVDVAELRRIRDEVESQLAAIEHHFMNPSAG